MDNKQKLINCIKVHIKFNYDYKLIYINQNGYNKLCEIISLLRKDKEIDFYEHGIFQDCYKHFYRNYNKIKQLERQKPRNIAQKFIGRKKIRHFIFKRDNFECLKCKNKSKLQLDHIIPISKGGENSIFNLQTLCNSCNSKKKDNYGDYRNGSPKINTKRHGRK